MSSTSIKDDTHDAEALSIPINKKESISDRKSPRRMEILIKRLENEDNEPSSNVEKETNVSMPVPKRSEADEDDASEVLDMINIY